LVKQAILISVISFVFSSVIKTKKKRTWKREDRLTKNTNERVTNETGMRGSEQLEGKELLCCTQIMKEKEKEENERN